MATCDIHCLHFTLAMGYNFVTGLFILSGEQYSWNGKQNLHRFNSFVSDPGEDEGWASWLSIWAFFVGKFLVKLFLGTVGLDPPWTASKNWLYLDSPGITETGSDMIYIELEKDYFGNVAYMWD